MSSTPIIAFGQQPCGFFPRRFLVSKILTARRLQREMGGEIVFFYHDADHDPRETQTLLREDESSETRTLNFTFANKLQRKFSPLYCKRVLPDWPADMARQLGAWVDEAAIAAFKSARADNVADFCLEVYDALGLLRGVRVVRSSDPAVRRAACAVDDFFVDVFWRNETVRARKHATGLGLHRGGDVWEMLPPCEFGPEHVSPTRDTRLRWMQSVIGCTHYIAGAGEQAYLNVIEAPDITFVPRDSIDRAHEAFTQPL